MRRFSWTTEKERALTLVRAGYTQQETAEMLGVSRHIVAGWTRRRGWQERARELSNASLADWQQKLLVDAPPRRARERQFRQTMRALAASRRQIQRELRPARAHAADAATETLQRMQARYEQLAAQPPARRKPFWE